MNILEAIADRSLLGASPALHDLSTWRPWLTFLAAVYGLPLDAEGEALFRKCTGRSTYNPPPGGWPEVVCIVGRQAGKTRAASLLVAYEAAFAADTHDGEAYALLIAQDWRSAIRTSFSYLSAALEASPVLCRSIIRETADTIDLENGVRVGAYPCRPAAIRGLRARIVVLDELAFFRNSEGSAVDTEMLRSARPTLATTGGKLAIISSPYAQSGEVWERHRKYFGRDGAPTLVWQADAPTMNPTLPVDYLERMRVDDPEAYRSEVLGEFRVGISQLCDPEQLERCVVAGRRELLPVDGLEYLAFCDPSGGRADEFAVAIGHRQAKDCVVDVVRSWEAPFEPLAVVREAAVLLQRYRVKTIVGDRYAGEWPPEAFRQRGVKYEPCPIDRSQLYLELLAPVNARVVQLLDEPVTLRQLRCLERRTSPSGRDRVDHLRGAHDDRANVVAGLIFLLSSQAAQRTSIDAISASDRALIEKLASRVVRSWRYGLPRGKKPGLTIWDPLAPPMESDLHYEMRLLQATESVGLISWSEAELLAEDLRRRMQYEQDHAYLFKNPFAGPLNTKDGLEGRFGTAEDFMNGKSRKSRRTPDDDAA